MPKGSQDGCRSDVQLLVNSLQQFIVFRHIVEDALEEEGAYDLVYARFLLTHLPDPQAAVRQMLRAARPGGAVVLEDLDHSAVFSYPASAALEQFVALYNRVARLRDGTPEPLEDHDELRWLTAAQLDEVPWLDGDVQIVTALARHLAPPR